MTNFLAAYKRDFWKIIACAALAAVLIRVLGYALGLIRPLHNPAAGQLMIFIMSFRTEFLYFLFYCACAMFFFGMKKDYIAKLLAKYFYVPVILAGWTLAINALSSRVVIYMVHSDIQPVIGGFHIPYSWMYIPFLLVEVIIAALILFVLLTAISRGESWPKAWGTFLGGFKKLFLGFVCWEFCIAALPALIIFARVSMFGGVPSSLLFSLNSVVSLVLMALLIYYIFQKTAVGGAAKAA